jgi:pimeloyl-ACP methyl ester carboxylesterase
MLKILEKLSQDGFTLLCPSRPGYLRTPLVDIITFEQEADMFAALLDSLGIHEKVVIYGVSLGGPAALQFALRYPDRTSAVILQDAVTTQYAGNSGEQTKELLINELIMGETGLDQRSWIQRLICDRWISTLFYQYTQLTNNLDAETNQQIALDLMAIPSERERFSQLIDMFAPMSMRLPGTIQELAQTAVLPEYPVENIHVPFLYTQSTVDSDVEIHHAQFIVDRLPSVTLYTFEGIGHFFWFGPEWDKVYLVMKDFLFANTSSGCFIPYYH